MITIDLPASMTCVDKGCESKLSVALALGVMGNLMPRLPNGHGWQLTNAQNGAFVCRCPKHHRLLDTSTPRLDDLGGRH